MDIGGEFRFAVGRLIGGSADGGALLPSLWARACATVLEVPGAGISVVRDLRVPLGASDGTSAAAEELQTSLGEGPCLAAVELMEPISVSAAELESRWPLFNAELMRRTPYRSVVSVPLRWGEPLRRVGALDLYLTETEPAASLMYDADEVAAEIAEMMFVPGPSLERSGMSMPVWMSGDSAARRLDVWIAVGMLVGRVGMKSSDALAVLRGYAYRTGESLDGVAAAMVSQDIRPEVILDEKAVD